MKLAEKFAAGAAATALLFACPALAQSTFPAGSPGVVLVDPLSNQSYNGSHPVPISGSFSATLSGFAPGAAWTTPLVVGASSSRVALPTGATVMVYNVGANAAYVALGNASVVATASNDYVPAGGCLPLTVGANVDLAAIETAGATTLNLSGGTGLGVCSGGGGGGGGGTVTQGPAGASPWLVTGTGGTFPVTGTFWQATQPVSLATAPTTPVTGTFWQTTQPVSLASLPSGAVTAISGAYVSGSIADLYSATPPTPYAGTGAASTIAELDAIRQNSANATALTGSATAGITGTYSEIVPANTTGISIKGTAGTLYGIPSLTNNGTVPLYVKFYNSASAPTCGSGTPVLRFEIPVNAATAADGAGSNPPIPAAGIAFSSGIGMCVTGGIADADTTNPTASIALVNVAFQ